MISIRHNVCHIFKLPVCHGHVVTVCDPVLVPLKMSVRFSYLLFFSTNRTRIILFPLSLPMVPSLYLEAERYHLTDLIVSLNQLDSFSCDSEKLTLLQKYTRLAQIYRRHWQFAVSVFTSVLKGKHGMTFYCVLIRIYCWKEIFV